MMRNWMVLSVAVLLGVVACGESRPGMSRTPASVRGWIVDIEHPTEGSKRLTNPQMESDRLVAAFQQTNLVVENISHASGGIGDNGAFVILDVPPGASTITFQTAFGDASIELKNVPKNADILLPNLIIRPPAVRILQPSTVLVRIPSRTATRPVELASEVTVGGHKVRVFETPIDQLSDRRDYPTPQYGLRPIAIVK